MLVGPNLFVEAGLFASCSEYVELVLFGGGCQIDRIFTLEIYDEIIEFPDVHFPPDAFSDVETYFNHTTVVD